MDNLKNLKTDDLKQILNLPDHKKICTKHIKQRKREIMALSYLTLFKEAIQMINYSKKLLFNIWDMLEIEYFQPKSGFFLNPTNISFKNKSKINAIWKKYQTTETGNVSIFHNLERIKLVNQVLNDSMNLNLLIELDFIKHIFPLNDSYELAGSSNLALFEHLFSKSFKTDLLIQQTYYYPLIESVAV